ncbi:SLATT domain-containing protein [Streptomyces sp. ST2-7A]|uniref:SLATT domain-containing protein n=1 Tax=Streptomyces sp. ST2-7A TaxID=2907214 RepID=UPI001F2C0F2E|nr:SLATT domain-containing protein [Streptomyces sp. ST2-7A]MCE7080867.1 SLATT domain-containing protein [Streptomyces sp. ST2-7A]
MSQPEKGPEGGPEGRAGGLAGAREGRRRGDLTSGPFPHGDWGEPAARLDELYRRVEGEALRTVEWYLTDRRGKRGAARALRLGSVLGAAAGLALPLLEAVGVAGVGPWGYPLLLGAVACLACDRWFGLTSGWMRDVATAQAVQRRLEALRYEWATESVREALGPTEGTAGEAAERCLGVLRRFSEDVTELVRAETADWMLEFRGGGTALLTQTTTAAAAGGGGGGREEGPPGGRVAVGRFPSQPPGARPTMPRQRPPEGPRL